MKKHHSILFYSPRIIAIIIDVFFLSVAFMVEGAGNIVIGLIPGLLVVLAVIAFWKRPRSAAIAFAALTIVYTIIGLVLIPEAVHGAVTLPLVIVSALLIFNVKSHMLD